MPSIAIQAADLAKDTDTAAAVGQLITLAGGDRTALESARDQVATQVHDRVDDYGATATLTLLNLALSRLPRTDPMDWRVRWAHHRKP